MSYEYSKLHNVQENKFSIKFFGDDNISKLQHILVAELKNRGYITRLQCPDKIISYMNNIYEIYANPHTHEVLREIEKLNKLVLEKMISVMIFEIKQYMGYIKDASRLPEPIARPQHISTKNSLEYKNFF